jgi:hypothetical protein
MVHSTGVSHSTRKDIQKCHTIQVAFLRTSNPFAVHFVVFVCFFGARLWNKNVALLRRTLVPQILSEKKKSGSLLQE